MEEAAVCRSSRAPHKVCQWSELCITPPDLVPEPFVLTLVAVLPLSLLSPQVASVLRPLVFLRQFSRNEVLQIRPVVTQELLLSGSPFWGGFRRGRQTADVTLWMKDWLLLPGGRYNHNVVISVSLIWVITI